MRLVRWFRPTFRYWMETEVHVYAFSVAANVLLSFFPFLIVIMSLCRYVFHWNAAVDAIYTGLQDYFPDTAGEFIKRNLVATVESRGPLQFGSIGLLLFTANGVFEPLEVALNRVWGISTNRSFVKNQVISLGLIFACGSLALLSTSLTAVNSGYMVKALGASKLTAFFTVLVFKAAAVPLVMVVLFLIYWLLPNGPVPKGRIIAAAIGVGLLLEVLKYINLIMWPWFQAKLSKEYGPFQYSVAVIFWSFFASMLILAGAEWSARNRLTAIPKDIQPATPVPF